MRKSMIVTLIGLLIMVALFYVAIQKDDICQRSTLIREATCAVTLNGGTINSHITGTITLHDLYAVVFNDKYAVYYYPGIFTVKDGDNVPAGQVIGTNVSVGNLKTEILVYDLTTKTWLEPHTVFNLTGEKAVPRSEPPQSNKTHSALPVYIFIVALVLIVIVVRRFKKALVIGWGFAGIVTLFCIGLVIANPNPVEAQDTSSNNLEASPIPTMIPATPILLPSVTPTSAPTIIPTATPTAIQTDLPEQPEKSQEQEEEAQSTNYTVPTPPGGPLLGYPDFGVEAASPDPDGQKIVVIQIIVSDYWPNKGPINCGDYHHNYCWSATTSGTPWQECTGRCVAMPDNVPFGAKLYVFGKEWIVADRGSAVVMLNGAYWTDFMVPESILPYGTVVEAILVYP